MGEDTDQFLTFTDLAVTAVIVEVLRAKTDFIHQIQGGSQDLLVLQTKRFGIITVNGRETDEQSQVTFHVFCFTFYECFFCKRHYLILQ